MKDVDNEMIGIHCNISDEADTDLETDRLLGQQRTDDQGFFDDKVSNIIHTHTLLCITHSEIGLYLPGPIVKSKLLRDLLKTRKKNHQIGQVI